MFTMIKQMFHVPFCLLYREYIRAIGLKGFTFALATVFFRSFSPSAVSEMEIEIKKRINRFLHLFVDKYAN